MSDSAALAPHDSPRSKEQFIWCFEHRRRFDVPNRSGAWLNVWIEHAYRTESVDGLPLDALLTAHPTLDSPTSTFGVIFLDPGQVPEAYPIRVLAIELSSPPKIRWLPRIKKNRAKAR